MASVERTAYPVLPNQVAAKELHRSYTLSEAEAEWISRSAKSPALSVGLAVQLKVFQQLHYFVPLDEIPQGIIDHVRQCMRFGTRTVPRYSNARTLYRHQVAIRQFLQVTPFYNSDGLALTAQIAEECAQVLEQRVDLINAMIEELIQRGYELPAYSTLNNAAETALANAQEATFNLVVARTPIEVIYRLKELLDTDFGRRQSDFNALKQAPKKPSRKHLEVLIDHLAWLDSFGDLDTIFEGIVETKIRHFSAQAAAADVSELKDCSLPKRYTLMLALIYRMRVRTRDHLAEMFIRRISTIHKRAKEELEQIQVRQRQKLERLVATLAGVLQILAQEPDDQEAGSLIREYLCPEGKLDQFREACAEVQATGGNNYLPLIWRHFKSHRSLLFRLSHLLQLEPTTQDRSLIQALHLIQDNENLHREWIDEHVDLSFASERWAKVVRRPASEGPPTNRRYLEVCVFSYLASELRSGDLCVKGSESFADYREQLLPWSVCLERLPAYCEKVGLPGTAKAFVAALKSQLEESAQQLDDKFPSCRGDVSINDAGEPVLRRVIARDIPPSAISLQTAIVQRMPARHVLDIMANIEHWIQFSRHFGPMSGNDPKLKAPAERYLMTIFAMGCNLGPNQAARHLAGNVTPHMLSYTNRRHLSLEKLDKANRELVELYLQLDLPKLWGDGKAVAADGTQFDFYDDNLLAGFHFRYRKLGAVAYRHVANNYIAVFQHFIPPGIWEAIYVIEGLLKADLSVEADTVYSDTQGQSATVFAFTHLLGINLMPRIRNWRDLVMCRPERGASYKHINRLFTDTADWHLIATHWQDLMQVALSIQAGKISSPMLLRKLGSYSRRNKLYHAAQALGSVIRTIFLLNWIGSRELRQEVTANTNKIESYNGFSKWLSFGGDVIAENDPDEQQKRLRYNDMVASSVILQNTVDMMCILKKLARDGWRFTDEDVSFLSPYLTNNVKRFGEFNLKLNRPPEAWIKDSVFQQAAGSLRGGTPNQASMEETP
ncbi:MULTISPECIES: Tn3 family transposase [Pseudomonas]|jgi:TnpA family transposase|uniref:Tn3 family transposase n=1 Tax=Pseudomonas TaxID=286 RepID=UPI00031CA7EF|nr:MULTISPECIES: Tn3 family transposase [Pseudomonas]KSW21996.1 transposase [Pseudomonas sp. ADP]EKW7196836.1 Tn3 family transposase [Pseudomonas aeruginosa]ELM3798910.1 Tn3 family transposase [Pseudomonas aeruginosa]MBG4342019.1 Tn3 family transposase [Pseudomonas aeruginosa]MBG5320340.1 Tn3 family transposase [Pseudomonas aeruginosa]